MSIIQLKTLATCGKENNLLPTCGNDNKCYCRHVVKITSFTADMRNDSRFYCRHVVMITGVTADMW